MNPTVGAILAGAGFGLWSLVMSLSGLRAGGVAFMLLAGTMLVIVPYYWFINPQPYMEAGRNVQTALLVGLFAACLNGLGMVFLPPLLVAPPAVVGTRILIINLTVVAISAIWSVAYAGQSMSASKLAGLACGVAAVWLLSR